MCFSIKNKEEIQDTHFHSFEVTSGCDASLLCTCTIIQNLLLACDIVFSCFQGIHLQLYPVMIHTFMLAVFASLIAPFGGFFASGFKRAFQIKVLRVTIDAKCYLIIIFRIFLMPSQGMVVSWIGWTVKF